MEPVIIAVICTVVFGAVTALSVFIRQILLSRDKHLNDRAQQRALLHESSELEKLRTQMESNKRFDSHYQVLGANRESIEYIDQKIQGILDKKMELIQRYAQMTLKESSAIIDGGQSPERKGMCDLLKDEIDREIKFYEIELQKLQAHRASIWDSRLDLQDSLIAHEELRNENLDKLYVGHTGLLEKIYIRHDESTEHFAEQTLEAGTRSFKETLMAPIRFLKQYFKASGNVSPDKIADEKASRMRVGDAEEKINGSGKKVKDEDVKTDDLLAPLTP